MTGVPIETDKELLVALHDVRKDVQYLIRGFDEFKEEMKELRAGDKVEIRDLKDRVTDLERQADRQSGFWAGANWLRSMIMTLPAGALAWWLGKSQ